MFDTAHGVKQQDKELDLHTSRVIHVCQYTFRNNTSLYILKVHQTTTVFS
jgi:hypothetical protein